VIRQARGRPEFKWAADLATMIQVSMIGFATGGAFLSLLYYDVPYYLMAAMVVVVSIVERALAEEATARGTRVAAAAAQPALATGT
jgi:hypothetical protein